MLSAACVLLLIGALVGVNAHPLAISLEKSPQNDGKLKNVVCPGGKSECPNGNTCCETSTKDIYACCPVLKAVCCPDKKHCCPGGYTCQESQCVKEDHTHPILGLIVTRTNSVEIHICPDKKTGCNDGATCCQRDDNTYGCCTLGSNAVCCSDKLHCCPQGTTCDDKKESCPSADQSHPMVLLVRRTERLGLSNMVCPNGVNECPDRNTCCLLLNGEYGCCPLAHAVCCSDGKHCCPEGYVCDSGSGECINRQSHPLFELLQNPVNPVECDDGTTECPGGNTCCRVQDGKYGCCPLPNATLGHPKELRNVQCPDKSVCPDGNTCCISLSGKYGCCPLINASCCDDKIHYCPNGYACDGTECKKASHFHPMLDLIGHN